MMRNEKRIRTILSLVLAALEDEPALLREHPIVIAQYLVETFGRETDDALVLVAR